MDKRDRYRGSLLGLAVADAVGTSVEFKAPGSFPPVTDMTGGGMFKLPVGAFTDDTSMALCLAESLIECEGFKPTDQLERYIKWRDEGYMSSTGKCFDIGISTAQALRKFEETGEPYPGDHFTSAGGNGSLMKLAPVPLAFANDPEAAVNHSAKAARTTHGLPEGIDAARYFGGLIAGAVEGKSADELVRDGAYEPFDRAWLYNPLHVDVWEIAEGSFMDKHPPEIRGQGYVLLSIEAALWALAHTDNFKDGVLAAVNLGDDADTTAAIYGQLAGAIYGVDDIPEEWLDKLYMREEITKLADGLLDHSEKFSPVLSD